MKCPVCRQYDLLPFELEPNLTANICRNCDGKWISQNAYQLWLKSHENLPELPSKEIKMTIPEFELAKLCPECRRILVKYKVGHNVPFNLDRCGTCAGVWLEKDEWEILRSRNLHDDLQKIFTDHWQEEVKQEETRNHLMLMYAEKFGREDYEQILRFKEWVDSHEKADEIKAYIRDPNPLLF